MLWRSLCVSLSLAMQNKVICYDNSRAFLEEVGEVLYSRETINNLILGVSERLVMDPQAYQNPFFASVNNESGEMLLASVMTPPHPMILAGGKHFARGLSALIPYLQRNGIALPGVIGPVQISEEFEKIWRRRTRQPGKIRMNQRVYELRSVRLPPLPEGQFRIAMPQDSRKVAAWLQSFSQEALSETAVSEEERAQSLIREGHVFVWENNSEAVSMALKTRPIAHSITISGV